MKKLILVLLLFFCGAISFYGQENHFEWNKSLGTFQNGLANQVAYINFGNAKFWGYIEVTITAGYGHRLTSGKYTKRFRIVKNLGQGYFNQESEIPSNFGPIGGEWKIGKLEFVDGNLRLPVYHLLSTGNTPHIYIEGTTVTAYDTKNITITPASTIVNEETRDYVNIKGSIGVGTTTPGAKFDVNGSLRAGDGNWGIITVNGKEKNDWAFNAHSDGKSFHVRTQTNTSTANSRIIMSMDRLTGNVGVNNPTPKSKFHVRTGTSGAKPHGYSDLTIEDSSHGMVSVLTPNNKKGYFGFADPEDDYVGGMEYEHAEDRLIFRTNNHNYDLVLNKDGNLGIGTTDTKGFKLGVNGKIAATEVKVATYANWPDYVFKKEYNLPSLQKVENHIKENGHLENIPNAEKVKKDGFFLGEMDAKLLQKIEELTLYTIQQEKEIKKANSNNDKLLSIIEKLEKRIEKLESK